MTFSVLSPWLARVDRIIGALCVGVAVLALPLAALLFLQWPLRELVQAYSREANDLGQLLFALYVSVAVSYATRCRVHLGTDLLARKYSPRLRRRVHRMAALVLVAPWALFVLWAGAGMIGQSVVALESFPDTYNPGYFLLKAATAMLVLLALLQAMLSAATAGGHGEQ